MTYIGLIVGHSRYNNNVNAYKIRTFACGGCGVSVTKRCPEKSRFCSLSCYRSASKPDRKTGETRACAVCDKSVYISKNRLGLAHYFCSPAHANEWQGRNKTEFICKICGKSFRWSPSRQANNNVTYCSLTCRDADPARTEMLLAMNKKQQEGFQSSAEVLGYALLGALGIVYLPQHLVAGKFCVDAFIPDAKVVVQFDGDYWHGNPARFSTLDARQAKRVRLDKSQDAYMVKCEFRVFRAWHSDLKDRPEQIKAELLRLLALA